MTLSEMHTPRVNQIFTLIPLFLMFFVRSLWADETYPFRIDTEKNAQQVALVAHNFGYAPISVAIYLQDLQNIQSDRNWPLVVVVPPTSTLLLGRLFPADPSRSWQYRYSSKFTVGPLGAIHDPGTLYRLPYREGATFTIGQAPGGPITTHTVPESQYAIDIPMPEGTSIVAARDGVIIDSEGNYTEGGRDPSLATKANEIRILHSDGTIGNYAHLRYKGIAVQNGQYVQAGEIIGYAGSTGYSSGPHLHFAVTRLIFQNSDFETISEPVTFYVGNPPVPFAAAYGMEIAANYSSAAVDPRMTQLDKSRKPSTNALVPMPTSASSPTAYIYFAVPKPVAEFLAEWWWALALSAMGLWFVALLPRESRASPANIRREPIFESDTRETLSDDERRSR